MKLGKVLTILSIGALLGALIWLLTSPGWEPLVTVIGLIAALITQVATGGKDKSAKMTQKGGKNSTNYQSNRDITINNSK